MSTPAYRIQAANRSPRCQHIKLNGVPCGAPALRDRQFCHFHVSLYDKRHQYDIDFIEDAHSLQIALMQTFRALRDREVDHRTAALMFYGLQTASANLRHLAREQKEASDLGTTEYEASLAEILLNQLDEDEAVKAAQLGFSPTDSPNLRPASDAAFWERVASAKERIASGDLPALPVSTAPYLPDRRP